MSDNLDAEFTSDPESELEYEPSVPLDNTPQILEMIQKSTQILLQHHTTLNSCIEGMKERYQSELKNARADHERVLASLKAEKGKTKQQSEQIEKKLEEIKGLTEKMDSARHAADELREKEKKKLEQDLEDSNKMLERLRRLRKKDETTIKELETRLEEREKQMNEKDKKDAKRTESLESKIKEATRVKKKLEKKLDSTHAELERVRSKAESDLKIHRKYHRARLRKADAEIGDLIDTAKDNYYRCELSEERSFELEAIIKDYKKRTKQLQAKVDLLSQNQSTNLTRVIWVGKGELIAVNEHSVHIPLPGKVSQLSQNDHQAAKMDQETVKRENREIMLLRTERDELSHQVLKLKQRISHSSPLPLSQPQPTLHKKNTCVPCERASVTCRMPAKRSRGNECKRCVDREIRCRRRSSSEESQLNQLMKPETGGIRVQEIMERLEEIEDLMDEENPRFKDAKLRLLDSLVHLLHVTPPTPFHAQRTRSLLQTFADKQRSLHDREEADRKIEAVWNFWITSDQGTTSEEEQTDSEQDYSAAASEGGENGDEEGEGGQEDEGILRRSSKSDDSGREKKRRRLDSSSK